jgi:hypothetical protein
MSAEYWMLDTLFRKRARITVNPTDPSNSSAAGFSFTGDDGTGTGVAGFACSLDGASFTACTSPQSYSGLADGSHTFQVRTIDNAGNADATPSSFTWVIDATAPDTIIDTSPTNPSSSASADFTFHGDDGTGTGVASFECQLDGGGFGTCASPQSYTSLADGSHTFQVRAIDNVGSVDPTPASFTWVIDTSEPDTTITATPPNPSASANASFSFTGNDGGGTGVVSFECQIDGGAFIACASPRTYTGLSDGSHTFQVRAVDMAGNADTSPASFTWVIDTTPPPAPVVITPANGGNTNNTQPLVSGTAEASSTVTVFLDGVAAGTTTADAVGNWTFTPPSPLSDGSHTARARSTDAVGNTSIDSNTNTFTVDTVAPTVTLTSAAPDPTNTSPIPVTVTFSESVTGFTAADIIPGNGTVSNFASSGSGYTFDLIPSGLGLVTADIAAAVAQDAATNPNTAAAQFSRTFVGPEIALLGNNIVIPDGDTSPSLTDQTDFGSVALGGAITRTFTISNSGNLNLTLSGSPLVALSGPASSDFSVVTNPISPVATNTTTLFRVRFDPAVLGTRAATVTIANNDSDENPYTFVISGTGISSSIALYLPLIFKDLVSAPDLVIVPGSLAAGSGSVTLQIQNVGNAPVTDAFWVDVYFNPNVTPSLNKRWQDIAPAGAVWGVSGAGLSQLTPGGTLTLTRGGAYYFPQFSSPVPLPVGASVFALADSVNFSTSYGSVLESNEGNNLRGPVISTASSGPLATGQAESPSPGGLPSRE